MMKKKKQSRSQSSTKKTLEPSSSSDASPSPRLLSIFRSKLVSGKDLKHMFRGMKNKTVPGLSSQSRIVRCPKCRKLLQEPLDATSYKCGGCDSILHAKRGEEQEGNDNNTIPLALLNRSFRTEDESSMRKTNRDESSVERGYHSDIHREWMRRADEFSSDAFNSARSSPYNSRSNASEGRYEDLLTRVPFYAASPSPSSAYEYGGYSSPFHGSQVSASEQSYYHHHQQQANQYGREGSFQESSSVVPGETSDGKYYHWPSQSQLNNLQYHNHYQAAAAPHRSTYSEHTSSEKRKPVVKRHVLPSGGGAPFATCSYCLELLQFPQVSIYGKHQVRCGSCSGVLKFSVRDKRDNTVLYSPSTGFVDETVTSTIHQDSASEGHEEISGDTICKSTTDAVSSSPSMKTFEDRWHVSNEFLDSKFVTLQPRLKPLVNHNSSEPLSETVGETSRIHIQGAHSEKLTETDKYNLKSVGNDLEESGYEKKEILKSEEMVGDGSSDEAETIAERPVSHSAEPLNKKEYVSETRVPSEETRVMHEFHGEETQEYGAESTWEEIMGDIPGLHLENSPNSGGSICDRPVEEDKEHMSNTFSDAVSATPQSPPKYLDNEIHEKQSSKQEQSQYEYENLNERQELSKTINERMRYELEESSYEINETLEPSKVGEDGSVVSLQKASETYRTIIEGDTERSVSHQMDSQNKNVENSHGTPEPFCFGYASERAWEETMGDRAGLHLEEYESNYENYSNPFDWSSERAPTFHTHVPEDDADERPVSSLRGSFNGHESSEEKAVFHESKDVIPEESQYEYENSSGRQELGNTVFDIVRSELQECRHETNETLEPGKMVGDRSVVSPKKAGETIIDESGEGSSASYLTEPQKDFYRAVEQVYLEGSRYASEETWAETMGDGAGLQLEEYKSNPFEWSSERAPTFSLHEYELGTMLEQDEDGDQRSESSSRGSFNNHESSEERAVSHEEELWLVDENKNEGVIVGVMVEDGPSLYLEKCENESMKLEETLQWTSIDRRHEYEEGTMLEPDEDDDGKSESSSRDSFSNHESSKGRAVFHEEEPQLVNDSRTEELQVSEIAKHEVLLEKDEKESMKLEETFGWTSERAPTFRLHEYELGKMLEIEEDADGRSEASSSGHGLSKEREMNHEDDPRLVIDSRNESLQVDEMVSLQLEECENESMKMDETFEWTSGRSLTFRRHGYELGTILEPDEDDDGKSESSSGSSEERAVIHEDEPCLVDDYQSKALQAGVMAEDEPSVHLKKCENDTLEQERMTMSQDKQENLRQTSEEDIPEIGSRVSSEEILGDHLEDMHKENEKSGLTFEPYARICTTREPSEIVGSCHALYETQSSPLRSPLTSPLHRSPLTSPIHTPIGSPLHYRMGSQIRSPIASPMHSHIVSPMRSPIASPMHSHIVSPMRSPINSTGSLSDVLFFGKKA